jgi:hypothetical protein
MISSVHGELKTPVSLEANETWVARKHIRRNFGRSFFFWPSRRLKWGLGSEGLKMGVEGVDGSKTEKERQEGRK